MRPSQMTALALETANLKKAALIFRAINHPVRQQILRLLHKSGKMTVTKIYVKLHLEQPVASTQLAILRRGHMVNTQRDGKFIYYSVNYKRLDQLHEIAEKLTGR